ncbi:MAG: hypothetical protein WBC93_02585, partial [Sulfitobacter sp.]
GLWRGPHATVTGKNLLKCGEKIVFDPTAGRNVNQLHSALNRNQLTLPEILNFNGLATSDVS